MIKDLHQRQHNYLRISLTERCNLRCFYCMPEEGLQLSPKSSLMTADEILYLARVFVGLGVDKIRLTGGEPLVRKDAAAIIEALGQLPVKLALTTNGILVDKFVPTFERIGLKAINISLDTLDENKFCMMTKRNDFQKVLDNIYKLLARGFEVKINAVLIAGLNDNEIIDFINFTKDLAVQIRFIEFMPFDGNQWDLSQCVSLDSILQRVAQTYPAPKIIRLKDEANDTAKNYKIEGYQGSFAIISTVTNPFCSSCNRIRLTANGRLKNCLFSTHETDLLTPLRLGQDVKPLLVQNIRAKKAVRGGWKQLEDFADSKNHRQNRSMILIGG